MSSISTQDNEHFDVLVLGGGVSGINAAHIVRSKLPTAKFAVLEGRDTIGGTWSFWKYPGFRCDSHMSTYAFPWYPWTKPEQVVSGQTIADYVEEAVDHAGLRKDIRLNHKINGLDWVSSDGRWVLDIEAGAKGEEKKERKTISAQWVISCLGYYSYDKALDTEIPGVENFGGQVIHPQWWPEDTNLKGTKTVILGSGATAMTIFPAITDDVAHVTLLQRSPSYVVSIGSKSPVQFLFRILPFFIASRVVRFANMMLEYISTKIFLRYPNWSKKLIRTGVLEKLGKDYDVDKHFKPKYNPWEQRMILSKDGELFDALKKPNAEIVTATIETMDKTGIITKSGQHIDADIIITATGLHVDPSGGMKISVDSKRIYPGKCYAWRGIMLEGVPNFGLISGYLLGSYTPGCNALVHTMVQIIRRSQKTGAISATPQMSEAERKEAVQKPYTNVSSTYFQKAMDRLPLNTGKGVWHGRENIWKDTRNRWFGSITEGLRYDRLELSKNR